MTIKEVKEWIKENPEEFEKEIQAIAEKLYKDDLLEKLDLTIKLLTAKGNKYGNDSNISLII